MNNPFPGARLKLDRAKRHITELDFAISEFLKENPHGIEIKTDGQGHLRVTAKMSEASTVGLSVIIGDAIHNLRSSLDHLAAGLIEMNDGTPGRNTAFPIDAAESGFNGNITSKLAGAADVAIAIVRAMKPYDTGNDGRPGNLNLVSLSRLDNDDKHLLLLASVAVARIGRILIKNPDGSVFLEMTDTEIGGNGDVNVLSVALADGMKVEASRQATFTIRFNGTSRFNGERVPETLRVLAKEVEKVIERFEVTLFPRIG
ncbi:MAG TPA: hypothetical protein VG867_03085 [Rhizomicrobium sp.]|nr:hypothetical protein [Rhizomicrobium sp.]